MRTIRGNFLFTNFCIASDIESGVVISLRASRQPSKRDIGSHIHLDLFVQAVDGFEMLLAYVWYGSTPHEYLGYYVLDGSSR